MCRYYDYKQMIVLLSLYLIPVHYSLNCAGRYFKLDSHSRASHSYNKPTSNALENDREEVRCYCVCNHNNDSKIYEIAHK